MRPVRDYGVDELRIVSGFASDSLARLHIERLKRQKPSVSVELIVGMTPPTRDRGEFSQRIFQAFRRSGFRIQLQVPTR